MYMDVHPPTHTRYAHVPSLFSLFWYVHISGLVSLFYC